VIVPARGRPTGLPLLYLGAAAAAFVSAAVGLLFVAPDLTGHYYHPRILALTHTVTLGWITLAIMGASYQLIPIVLQRPIWSERLARWQFWLLLVGISGMVAHFYLGTWPGLLSAAALVALGSCAHLLNVSLTLRGLSRWDFTARLVVMGYTGLGLTVVFGLALAANRMWALLPGSVFPRLEGHFHLALLGWVTPMVWGVAARVYPMFLLAVHPTGWPARAQSWGLALGVPAVVLGLLALPILVPWGAMAVAVAAIGHVAWVADIARRRKRSRLDWALCFVLTGAAFIIPGVALGLAFAVDLISGPRLAVAYAIVCLGGWVSLTIVGMMLKIIPFLVWYQRYAPHAGKGPVPTLAQLGWPKGEGVAWVFLTGAMILMPVAVVSGEAGWICGTAVLLSLGALAFAVSIACALRHLHRPYQGHASRLPAGVR
jgi:hypothetical protein